MVWLMMFWSYRLCWGSFEVARGLAEGLGGFLVC